MIAREFYEKNRAKVLGGLRSAAARGSTRCAFNAIERAPISFRAVNAPVRFPPSQRLVFDFEGHVDNRTGQIDAVIRCEGEIMEAIGRTGWIEQLAQKD